MFFSQAHLTVSALAALSAISGVAAHGYFSSPPVRGIEKASYNVDSLKSPNRSGAVCRGEGPGTITPVGQSVTLGFTITAPHVGPCTVYILDPDLTNQRQIAQKNNCAAPGQVGPWTITIPSDITGHKVIRWFWEAEHVTPHEMYENCADVQIGGGGSGGDIPAPEATPTPKPKTGPAPAPAPASPAPAPAPSSPPPSAPSTGGNNGSDSPTGSDGSGCQPGQYTCGPDGRLGQCSYGKYVWIRCAAGTTCHGSGSSVYCARSA